MTSMPALVKPEQAVLRSPDDIQMITLSGTGRSLGKSRAVFGNSAAATKLGCFGQKPGVQYGLTVRPAAKAAFQAKVAAVLTDSAATASAGKDATIFVVHGRDHDARDQLELILHRLGLEP